MALINGTSQRDTLNGTGGNDTLNGLGGDDRIITGDGSDVVDGGDGNDEVNGFAAGASRTFFPATGPKTIHGGAGDDYLIGGSVGDQIFGDDGADGLFGEAGNDRLDGGSGNDTLEGDDGNDTLLGGDGNDRILTGDGTDRVEAGDGDDTVNGYPDGTGRVFFPATGAKIILGGRGNDFVTGGAGSDSLLGEDGDDSLFGDGGNDTLDGGQGADVLNGGAGDDTYIVRNRFQQIEDSSGTDTVLVAGDFIKVPRAIETIRYESGAMSLPYWLDALIPDEAAGQAFARYLGVTKAIGYAFPLQRPSYDTDTARGTGWAPLSTLQQSRVLDALAVISSVIDVRFEASAQTNRPNVMVFATNRQTGSSGYAFYPSTSPLGSDVFLDNSARSSGNTTLADWTYGALTLIHEIGHALGLKHPFAHTDADGDVAQPPYLTGREESTAWTVMSYNDSPAQYRLQLSPLDIAALQYLYGPSPSARPGADRYAIDPSQANFIWDGGGMDVLSAATATGPATIYLTPGYWGWIGAQKGTAISDAGQVTVNFGTVIEGLEGSGFDDRLFGNEVANTLTGGAGADTLSGGGGSDRLIGGDGIDTALFQGLGSRFQLQWSAGSLQLHDTSGALGTDTLIGIERVAFDNRTAIVEARDKGDYSDLSPSLMNSVYQFFIVAFGAAPGTTYLDIIVQALRTGAPLRQVVNAFVQTDLFKATYLTSLSPQALASQLVSTVVKDSASAETQAIAVNQIASFVAAGSPLADVIIAVFGALARVPQQGDVWSGTSRLFAKQIAVAQFYTEVLDQSTNDRDTLVAALSAVTPQSDVSTEAAMAQLVGVGLFGG